VCEHILQFYSTAQKQEARELDKKEKKEVSAATSRQGFARQKKRFIAEKKVFNYQTPQCSH
jgi:hypothetical protein